MRRVFKWTGIIIGLVLLLAVVVGAGLFVRGGSKFEGPADLAPETLAVTGDSAQVARGAHIAATHGCELCHGVGLGGAVLLDAPPFRVVASNLTSAGVGTRLGVAGLEHAIRHGVGSDGRALMIMPSEVYQNLSDDETAALIAWVQSRPPVQNDLPATHIKPLGRIIAGTGNLATTVDLIGEPAPHTAMAPPVGATLEYGRHRASTTCVACHGPDLEGAQPPDPASPPAPTLMNAATWSSEQFRTALRTGRTPTRQLDGAYMPYAMTSNMTDDEIEAIHMYLRALANLPPATTAN